MNKEYFVALLPDFSNNFYKKIESLHFLECYPEFRLPFHTTLFFLGKLNIDDKKKVLGWLDKKKNYKAITAKIEKISSFKRDKKDSVFFLKLDSEKINFLNNELKMFSYIHKDSFDFIPHMSLFFPKISLSKKDFSILEESFKKFKNIKFKGIFLGSVSDNVVHVHKYILFVGKK